MQTQPSPPPKPVTEIWRPDLTQLPRLTFVRRLFRLFARGFVRLIVLVCTRCTIHGMENFPKHGPAIIVINHLGDADAVILAALLPAELDGFAKVELYNHWLVGPVFRAYGIIWLHRGRADRRAVRAALDGLAEGRMLGIAPEGRYTLTGELEEGTEGAAYLAIKSGAPIVPVALTGTENANVYGHLRRWRRVPMTLSVGKPFVLAQQPDHREALREGTQQIMESLAALLPDKYRGRYCHS